METTFNFFCANSSIIHPARKHPFRFRHESPLRFPGHEQSSGSGRFGRKSCRYGFHADLSDMHSWNMGVFPSKKAFFCFLDQLPAQPILYRDERMLISGVLQWFSVPTLWGFEQWRMIGNAGVQNWDGGRLGNTIDKSWFWSRPDAAPSAIPEYRECERIPLELSKKRIADSEILCAW